MDSLELPNKNQLENLQILKELPKAHRYLAELKGISKILPNKNILLNNLTLQEAQDSSSIENIITTQDSLYQYQIKPDLKGSNKEVYNYFKALTKGYKKIQSQNGISINTILDIQAIVKPDRPGFRKLLGTVLMNDKTGRIIYKPPSPEKIPHLMDQLEKYINENSTDPLIKMAIIHHCFETIHPFYDGNGRVGRILNILYLILNNLLEYPLLYLSRYILRYKSDYYRLLQQVREEKYWVDWIFYMLKAISTISQETINLINKIDTLFREYKQEIRKNYKFYSHDLINTIFSHPYSSVDLLVREMNISPATGNRYLEFLAKDGLLEKNKLGKKSYYINRRLFNLLKDS